MTIRKVRKKNKLRGHRVHGKGDTKNKRGAGSRGGRGRAGSHKHKYSLYYKDFGHKIRLKPTTGENAISLATLDSKIYTWVEKDKIQQKDGLYIIDGVMLGFSKVIAKGNISHKIEVINASVSEKAKEKIIAIGGNVVDLELESADEAEDEQ